MRKRQHTERRARAPRTHARTEADRTCKESMATPTAPAITRKTLFRRGEEDDSEMRDKEPSPNDKAIVEETLTALREEVKELAKTNWLYEGNVEIASRVKI